MRKLNQTLLCIDVGNTNITFGLFVADVLKDEWRLDTLDIESIEKISASLTQHSANKADGVIIGSVVPRITDILQNLKTTMVESKILFCNDEKIDWGFKILSGDKREVGEDILLNGVAGFAKYQQAILIVDFGTATTFDVFNDDGDFVGTVIAPGVNLSLKALYQAAAQLPKVSVEATDRVIGTNTKDCMQSGIFWGYVSLIEGLVDKIKKELKVDLQVIATGGLAPLFEEKTPVINIVEQSLTLQGLQILARRNSLLNEQN